MVRPTHDTLVGFDCMGMCGEGMVEGSLEVQGARNATSAAAEAAAESAKAAEP